MTKDEIKKKIDRCEAVLQHHYKRKRSSELVVSILRYYQKQYYKL